MYKKLSTKSLGQQSLPKSCSKCDSIEELIKEFFDFFTKKAYLYSQKCQMNLIL